MGKLLAVLSQRDVIGFCYSVLGVLQYFPEMSSLPSYFVDNVPALVSFLGGCCF